MNNILITFNTTTKNKQSIIYNKYDNRPLRSFKSREGIRKKNVLKFSIRLILIQSSDFQTKMSLIIFEFFLKKTKIKFLENFLFFYFI